MRSTAVSFLGIVILISFFMPGPMYAEWLTFDDSPGREPVLTKKSIVRDRIDIDFSLPGIFHRKETASTGSFDRITIPGKVTTNRIGFPDLPQFGEMFAYPKNAKLSVSIHDESWVTLDNMVVMPNQPKPNRCEAGKSFPFAMDARYYSTDTYTPQEQVLLEKVGILRDVHVARIALSPFSYNPVRKELRVLVSARITITIDAPKGADYFVRNTPLSPQFKSLYEASLMNHGAFLSDSKGLVAGEHILALVHDGLATAASPLWTWKREKGVDVTVALMSEVGNTVNDIKAYIQTAYDSWVNPPDYVLFVGNENTVVPDHRSTSNGNAASDYPYTLLSGSDILPDILQGRIVADDEADVTIQITKIISYEEEPFTGAAGNWYQKASGIASNEGSNPSDEDYIEDVEAGLSTGNGTYTSFDHFYQGSNTATTTNINNALNNGRSWLTYIGHGSGTSWGSTNTTYNNSSIAALSNGFKMPVLVDVACLNGQFDSSYECFGEAWMRSGTPESPKGAVGYYGGSVSVSWDPPAVMAVGCATRHFSTPVHSWGATCLAGQLYLVDQMGTGSDVVDNFEWYILFGDPSLVLRTDEPQTLNAQHQSVVFLGQTEIQVTVTTASKAPVSGALVSFKSNNQGAVRGSAVTNGAGVAVVSLNTPPTTPGTGKLTITGYNLDTYQVNLDVIPANGPYITLDSYTFDDNTKGNGNNVIDYGEDILLSLSLKNVGTSTAQGVVATISSTDPYVSIVDNNAAYGNVQASQVKTITNGFEIHIAENVPDEHGIVFTINSIDSSNNAWESSFSITAHAPVLTITDMVVDDTTGNNNGDCDPGEWVYLNVTIKNIGGSGIGDFLNVLQTSDPYMNIVQNQSVCGWVGGQGGEGMATFYVNISTTTPLGHDVHMNMISQKDGTTICSTPLSVRVGLIAAYIWNASGNSSTVNVLENYYASHSLSFDSGETLPADLGLYKIVYVLLGIYSSNHVLTSSEGTQLAAFLDLGGNIYMEGGDTWSYDQATAVHPYFHIDGVSDGSGDTGTVAGTNGTMTEGMLFNYQGPNSYMDRLEGVNGATVILNNQSPAYANAIVYDSGTYRTIGASFELGGLSGSSKDIQVDELISSFDSFLANKESTSVPTLFESGAALLLFGMSIMMMRRRKK